MKDRLIYERSVKGRVGYAWPTLDVPRIEPKEILSKTHIRAEAPKLPEVSEFDVVRHFTRLSQDNFSVDTNFYPLGSCTMKYNPKVNEKVAAMDGFAQIHPLQPEQHLQGILQLHWELEQLLSEITGMAAYTLQPSAGAQGELAGIKIILSYFQCKNEKRSTILIPDSAHGTNPATAALSQFKVVEVKSGADGLVDLADLKSKLNEDVAALMLTNPNTLGLFEKDILTITKLLHEVGALVYMDGANMNALLGNARPGDMQVDIMHLNLHKTFSTPHGGGGPGAGPVGVAKHLEDFLPVPRVRKKDGQLFWDYRAEHSIGRLHGFYGNVGVLVRAYTYIRFLGNTGIMRAGKTALINANYIKKKLEHLYPVPYGDLCMHEFVASAKSLKQYGVTAQDVAKRLLDFGFYAPTVYFPLIVEEALMIEPTETESKESLDAFIDAMLAIAEEAKAGLAPEAPQNMPVQRVDEVRAAREPNLRWLPPASSLPTEPPTQALGQSSMRMDSSSQTF